MAKGLPGHLDHSHDRESIRKRLGQSRHPSLARDFIFGGMDGIVTTFSIVAGVAGAGLSNSTVIVLGFANILADGFSMAASNYLGTKAEHDERELIVEHELRQMKVDPEGEKREVEEILRNKGLSGEVLLKASESISSRSEEWLKLMLSEEYGHSGELRSPMKAGAATFVAFLIFGLLPLLPYLFLSKWQFPWSAGFTGLSFFALGAIKSRWSMEKAWVGGSKTLLIGSLAAGGAFGVGVLLKDLVP